MQPKISKINRNKLKKKNNNRDALITLTEPGQVPLENEGRKASELKQSTELKQSIAPHPGLAT